MPLLHVSNQLRQLHNQFLRIERLEQYFNHRVPIHQRLQLLPSKHMQHRHQNRCGVERLYQNKKAGFQIGVCFATRSIGGAASKKGVKGAIHVGNGVHRQVGRQRVGGIQHHAANAIGEVAHDRLRQPRAVGDAVQIPLVITQSAAQIVHVGGVFAAVVSSQINPFTAQPVTARRHHCQQQTLGLFAVQIFIQGGKR